MGRTIPKQIRKPLYHYNGMQVLVLQQTYNTLDILYVCTVLTLTLPMGPRDIVGVSKGSYRDLIRTGQPSASYSDSAPYRRRARRAQYTFPPMGAGINGWFQVELHATCHTWVAAYTPRSHLEKRPIVLIFVVEHHVLDLRRVHTRSASKFQLVH